MKRRTFLKISAVTGVSLVPSRARASAKKSAPSRTEESIAALATIYLPAHLASRVDRKKAAARVKEFTSNLPRHLKLSLSLSVRIVNLISLFKFGKSIEKLSFEEKEKLMASLWASRLRIIQTCAVIAKMMTGIGFYASEEGYALSGFRYACSTAGEAKSSGTQEGAR